MIIQRNIWTTILIDSIVMCGLWLTLSGCTSVQHSSSLNVWQCDEEADTLVEAGDWQQGLEAHMRLLVKEPSNCLALFHLGYIWGELGERQKEIELYNQSINCGYDEDDRLFFNLGMAYISIGQLSAALNALEKALSIGPDNPDNHFGYGLVSRETGRMEQAARALEKALILDPQYREARVELVRVYLDQSRWEDARRQLLLLDQGESDDAVTAQLWDILKNRRLGEYPVSETRP
jgi:tetratricopeptide (TPR) repeat protein